MPKFFIEIIVDFLIVYLVSFFIMTVVLDFEGTDTIATICVTIGVILVLPKVIKIKL